MKGNEVYIISYARTPIGKFSGKLKDFHPADLGSIVIKEVLNRAKLEPNKVDIVIMGNVLRAGHGQDLARQAAIKAGIPYDIDAYSVDMVCSSGMMSVINAIQSIRSGDSNVVIAGGMESMSKAGFLIGSEVRWGVKMLMNKSINLIDTMLIDGLTDPFNFKLMGMEADMVAKAHDISRRELDEIAFESHRRAARARRQGLFREEIVEVPLNNNEVFIDDEGIREDTTIEKLSKLPPAFSKDGLHTAGNSSQISDGAAALLLANDVAIKEFGLKPVARILGYTWVGIESWRFPEAPIYAIKKLLNKLNMKLSE
ncbi:MAG: thiolase family protein, partial [Sulfolobaceae archaeon]